MSIESDLRNTSDRLLEELARLADLESAKRETKPGSHEFVDLSQKVEALAAELLGTSQRQSALAATTEALRKAGANGVTSTPIAEIPAAREPNAILSDWRAAERRLAAAEAGSVDHQVAQQDVERLREEYRRSFEARR